MPASADTPAQFSYLALGDSYTIGEGVPEEDRWGVLLTGMLREEGVNVADPYIIARTGWTTAELAAAIAEEKLEQTFDLVSLLVGVNNQYRGQPLDTYQTEFQELLHTAVRFAGNNPQKVLVLSIPDWGATPFAQGRDLQRIAEEIDAYNAVAKKASIEAGTMYIDITPLTRKGPSDSALLADDGLHYSKKMHREWAELALPEALRILT